MSGENSVIVVVHERDQAYHARVRKTGETASNSADREIAARCAAAKALGCPGQGIILHEIAGGKSWRIEYVARRRRPGEKEVA